MQLAKLSTCIDSTTLPVFEKKKRKPLSVIFFFFQVFQEIEY